MSAAGRISDIRATTVAVPLEAPIRHAHGAHWGRFVRTLVEVETDEGLLGVGEMGGGGESAEAAVAAMKEYLLGHDPANLEAMRWKIANPTAGLYNARLQIHAALEFACLDIVGKATGLRACELLGGSLRESVPFASYLFYRYRNEETGVGGEETPEEVVAHARDLTDRYGFGTHKLKGGVFPPEHDVRVLRALAEAFPEASLRLDPNGVWSVEQGIRVAREIQDLNNDYLEDPTWGMEGMARVRERISIPTSTNQVVVNLEQLATAVRLRAVDVVLLDTTFWGGLRQAYLAGKVCETFQVGVAVHSSGELGVQLATMLHLGAALPNLVFAADAHYHHLTDDVVEGGMFRYSGGEISVPTSPGLGVALDRDKVGEYAELFEELGGYPYDRDPGRPGWYSTAPNSSYASLKEKGSHGRSR
jgi:glucarate dehydratase